MFTVTERGAIRDSLVERARVDDGVVAAALVGSAARGEEDAFSDIDLVLRVAQDADPAEVSRRWTEHLYAEHRAAHHLDVIAGGVLYRVFLLHFWRRVSGRTGPVASTATPPQSRWRRRQRAGYRGRHGRHAPRTAR
ncbi:Nucleotidyltransferase domain-containing protein [Ruania alba]|uniref:Nucleotidyltransferase domain-containing protein n=1 Tax=Ruania alba TaxID=648782 RepID=A0A1H5LEL7_9MICO|nr:Nucleotidyltransferase domain-containing protein [Ruania alba]